MDLAVSWSIECIGFAHPVLWVAVGTASLVNWMLGTVVAYGWYAVKDLGRRIAYLGPFVIVAAAVAAASAYLILLVLYRFVSAGTVCVHFVWPILPLPLLVGVAAFIKVKRKVVVAAVA